MSIGVFMHWSNIWLIMLQHFVCVDSHAPGNPHVSIFFDWQGLTVIPLVSTLYSILAHLPVYLQGHPVRTRPMLSLGKLLASFDNVSYCFRGISTQSAQRCFWGLYLIEFVLKASSWAARIKPSISFCKNPFLSHLRDSCFQPSLSPSMQREAFSLCSLWGSHEGICTPFLRTLLDADQSSSPFLSQQVQPPKTLLPVCTQPFIAKIFLALLSMLPTSSIVQSTILHCRVQH